MSDIDDAINGVLSARQKQGIRFPQTDDGQPVVPQGQAPDQIDQQNQIAFKAGDGDEIVGTYVIAFRKLLTGDSQNETVINNFKGPTKEQIEKFKNDLKERNDFYKKDKNNARGLSDATYQAILERIKIVEDGYEKIKKAIEGVVKNTPKDKSEELKKDLGSKPPLEVIAERLHTDPIKREDAKRELKEAFTQLFSADKEEALVILRRIAAQAGLYVDKDEISGEGLPVNPHKNRNRHSIEVGALTAYRIYNRGNEMKRAGDILTKLGKFAKFPRLATKLSSLGRISALAMAGRALATAGKAAGKNIGRLSGVASVGCALWDLADKASYSDKIAAEAKNIDAELAEYNKMSPEEKTEYDEELKELYQSIDTDDLGPLKGKEITNFEDYAKHIKHEVSQSQNDFTTSTIATGVGAVIGGVIGFFFGFGGGAIPGAMIGAGIGNLVGDGINMFRRNGWGAPAKIIKSIGRTVSDLGNGIAEGAKYVWNNGLKGICSKIQGAFSWLGNALGGGGVQRRRLVN